MFQRKEREIIQQLEAQEDNTAEIHETFTNLRQEVEMKTKKLKKLYMKLQQVVSLIFKSKLVVCLDNTLEEVFEI